MQKRLFALLSCLIITVTGCDSIKNENAIHSIMNNEGQVIELKAETVEHMINEKYSFSLLMYTNNCSYCEKAKENLAKLASKDGYATYQIEMYSASINYLSEKLPDLYKVEDTYPFMYFINEGKVSYKSKVEDLIQYTNLKKLIKAYSISTSITNLTTLDYYNIYKKDHAGYLLYTYDSSIIDEKDIYSLYVFPRAVKTDKNVLIIDKKTAKSDLISEIKEVYGDGFDILSIYSFGKIKTTLRYSNESGSSIDNFISSYF